jgi:tRNA (guanine37-N1)-methyltransferase
MLQIDLISIFPEYLSPLNLSLLGKAQDKGVLSINIHDLRNQTNDVHHSVDDTPYGGGAGMVMSPVAWGQAIDQITNENELVDLIILTPAGKKFDQKMASQFATAKHIIFACGRYEGIDARVGEYYASKPNFKVHEVSIGDYVLGGGEVAAMVIIEATARLIPGVIGNPDSLKEESHSISGNNHDLLVEYPNYTKPANWRGLEVPPVLLSGNHGEIAKWRKEQAERRTRELDKE